MADFAIKQSKISSISTQLANPTQKLPKILVEQLENPSGEGNCHFEHEHTLFISLASRPVQYLQIQDGKTYNGLYRQGDILITPANTPLFVRWKGNENCLQIQLSDQFLRNVAEETFNYNCDNLELIPQFQVYDSQIESISTMLRKELQEEEFKSKLYLDSLANVLAVNLVRHHTTKKRCLPIYEGGLSPRQLGQVLDYIDANLEQDLKLENLAQLVDLSQFHFSRLFKQSIGLSPYQYLIEQRIERAKKLLKQTNHSIVEIALDCGFNSHSHLTKQFRQLTGLTPKVYRKS